MAPLSKQKTSLVTAGIYCRISPPLSGATDRRLFHGAGWICETDV